MILYNHDQFGRLSLLAPRSKLPLSRTNVFLSLALFLPSRLVFPILFFPLSFSHYFSFPVQLWGFPNFFFTGSILCSLDS